jgi:restriction system protein
MIDSYNLPTLRRGILRLVRLDLWVKASLRELRHVDGWWMLAIGFGLLAVAIRTWIYVGIFIGLLGLSAAMWAVERRQFELARVDETDALSGHEFERWIESFLAELGFDVEHVGRTGDFGGDLVATWNATRTVVQAKSGHYKVGVSAVRQAYAAKTYYDCERAMVVTNQYFTDQALLLAEKTGVVMRHRGDLARVLAERNRKTVCD